MSELEITRLQTLVDEKLNLGNNRAHGTLSMYSGKQGDFLVSLIPSLNVSGYGSTDQEAYESILENLNIFFNDLFALTEVQMHRELKKLGWKSSQYFKNKISASYIDEHGVLQNFDNPAEVKKTTLQAV